MMRIGTRKSLLAETQARGIQGELAKLGVQSTLVFIESKGDIDLTKPLYAFGGEATGLFTKELENALLRNEIDLAVHSLKDLPTESSPLLKTIAIPKREDARDVLVLNKKMGEWKQDFRLLGNKVIGTSSLRRTGILHSLEPQSRAVNLRGNVPTRIEKVRSGQLDGVFLAKAGVSRLKLDLKDFHVVELDISQSVPAPGQGALALQTRVDISSNWLASLMKLNCDTTSNAVVTERKVLRRLMGGCSLPLGVYACYAEGSWKVWAYLAHFGMDSKVEHCFLKFENSRLENLAEDCSRELLVWKGVVE